MKIIVTGYKGFIGSRILKAFDEKNHDVVGVGRENADITNYSQVKMLFSQVKPDLVIHCAAIGDIWRCEEDHDKAWKTNVIGTRNIASACEDTGSRLIALSSDQVYNYFGSGKLRENVKTDPVNFYGTTKVESENEIRNILNRHYILRISWQYGWSEQGMPNSRDGLLEQVYNCMQKGEKIKYSTASRQNITYVYDTVHVIEAMSCHKFPYGTYNVASENSMTDFETKEYMIRMLGGTESQIKEILVEDKTNKTFDLRAEPYNLKLCGYEMPKFTEGLNRCFKEIVRFGGI